MLSACSIVKVSRAKVITIEPSADALRSQSSYKNQMVVINLARFERLTKREEVVRDLGLHRRFAKT
jgi:hypothetical protein